MDENGVFTMVRCDMETKRKLRFLAARYRRSMASQLGWMVEVAYEKELNSQAAAQGQPEVEKIAEL